LRPVKARPKGGLVDLTERTKGKAVQIIGTTIPCVARGIRTTRAVSITFWNINPV